MLTLMEDDQIVISRSCSSVGSLMTDGNSIDSLMHDVGLDLG